MGRGWSTGIGSVCVAALVLSGCGGRSATIPTTTIINVAPTSGLVQTNPVLTDPSGPQGVSGQSMPTVTLPGWRMVFSDDFPSSEDSPTGSFSDCHWIVPEVDSTCSGLPRASESNWFAAPSGSWPVPSGEQTLFDPAQVLSIGHGMLSFHLGADRTGRAEVATAQPRILGFPAGFRSGAFAVRFRADRVPGYSVAFQLWPVSKNWRQDGGLQFPGGELTGPVSAVVGQPGVAYGSSDKTFKSTSYYTRWHTALTVWNARGVTFYLDGRELASDGRYIPTTPHEWLLQTGPALGASRGPGRSTGTVQVAWAVAWVTAPPAPGVTPSVVPIPAS